MNVGKSLLCAEVDGGGGIDEVRCLKALTHPDIKALEVKARIFLLNEYPHTLHSASQSRPPAATKRLSRLRPI